MFLTTILIRTINFGNIFGSLFHILSSRLHLALYALPEILERGEFFVVFDKWQSDLVVIFGKWQSDLVAPALSFPLCTNSNLVRKLPVNIQYLSSKANSQPRTGTTSSPRCARSPQTPRMVRPRMHRAPASPHAARTLSRALSRARPAGRCRTLTSVCMAGLDAVVARVDASAPGRRRGIPRMDGARADV